MVFLELSSKQIDKTCKEIMKQRFGVLKDVDNTNRTIRVLMSASSV